MTISDALKKIGNTYTVSAQCMNCGMRQQVKVTKGVSLSDYFNQSSGLCQHCGCATLAKAQPSVVKKIEPIFEPPSKSNDDIGNFWGGKKPNDNEKKRYRTKHS